MKKIFTMAMLLLTMLAGSNTAWAEDTTYSPTKEVNFRTAAGNTGWNSGYPKDATAEGVTTMEGNYFAGMFVLQQYTVADLANATSITLILTDAASTGVDGTMLWIYPDNNWSASSSIDDMINNVTDVVGVAPRSTEGTTNSPLVTASKVANSSPAQAKFTISGAALATLKSKASADGTFTLMITDKSLTSNSSRKFRSSNTATDEAYRPTLTATIETPAVVNKTTGVGYASLTEAFNAAVDADADAELEVSEDQTLTGRLTWNKAHTLTITPTKDITIKANGTGYMWFLANVNNAVLNIGSTDYTITLDGQSKQYGIDVTKGENTSKLNLTNIVFQDFDLKNAGHLVGTKEKQDVTLTLDKVTFKNCTNPADGFINKQRVKNDMLILKGYLNQENCTGTTIYMVGETKADGTTGRIKVDDSNFTANASITLNYSGITKAEGIVVAIGTSASNASLFQLTDEEWLLERKSNGDLYMTQPAQPTVKIGETGYADLSAALASAQDGNVITLLADQEISARMDIKDMAITIDGQSQYAIKRATSYTDKLVFLTAAKSADGKAATLTLQNLTLDGQSVETSAAFIEAGNSGTTTLNNVTIKNVNTTANAVIVNKGGGKLTLNGVTFTGCTAAKADVFDGNSVTLSGQNTIPSIYVEKSLVLTATDATATSPIEIKVDEGRAFGQVIEGGDATQFTSTDFRLSQQTDGVYLMPKAVAASYNHPALLHTSSDIEAVKTRLADNEELATAAYGRLEAQSGGQAAGAVEVLKRMDAANWSSTYPDYGNFSRAATDARLAYSLALRYQLKNSTAAATQAVNILNDWAKTNKGVLRLKNYANNIPDPNEYLMTIQAYQFANAAELLRGYEGWTDADQQKFQNWIRQTFADVAIQFLENHHKNDNPLHYWLNWDLAALNALLSVGILCDDQSLVDYALNYTTQGTGTGNVQNAVVATHQDADSEETLAQCQESGRDQGHSTLDITLLGVLCQTAQNIGTDLFTPYKALEMAEYVGKYNLKNAEGGFVYDNVPFSTYNNGEVEHTAISADARGTERPCWELFHAYAKANGKSDIYTEAWVKYMRQQNAWGEGEASSTDELGFGTLMFGAEVAATGIDNAITDAQGSTLNAQPFNLSGQRVQNGYRGLVIKNGRKYIAK